MVFDFGGGTLDLAYLRKEDDGEWHMPVPPIGEDLGGDDFDRLIYDHFERELQQTHGISFGRNGSHNLAILHQCRLAKEKLSSQTKARLSYLMPESNLSMRFDLDRAGLSALIQNDVLKAGQLAQRMIEQVNQSGHEVDFVILIGGATRMPAIQETLKSGLSVKPMATMHADVAVAMGGANTCPAGNNATSTWLYVGFAHTENLAAAIERNDIVTVKQLTQRIIINEVFLPKAQIQLPALCYAAHCGHIEIIRYLILRGMCVNAVDTNGASALHYAAQEGHLAIFAILQESGADLRAHDLEWRTPLHYAVQNCQHNVVKWLLSKGGDPLAGDSCGNTPLHMAALTGDKHLFQLIADNGGDLTQYNYANLTPYQVAYNHRLWEICDIIKKQQCFDMSMIRRTLKSVFRRPQHSRQRAAVHEYFESSSYRKALKEDCGVGITKRIISI
jgi:hypothetical protein